MIKRPESHDKTNEAAPPAVARLCHLRGGLSALNNPGIKTQLCAGVEGPVLAEFNLPSFSKLFAILASLGTPVIGCEFFLDQDEIQGLRPPSFRVFYPDRGWLAYDAWGKWREVAAAALKSDQMDVADCAARIAFELEAAEYRCRELCRAYSNQLRSLAIQRTLEEYKRFDDLNSGPVIHCIHAVFYELAVLRDYLAEFIARFALPAKTKDGAPIRTMAKLSRYLSANVVDDPLSTEILQITSQVESSPGWLAVLSAYRNLFAHVAPLQQAATRSFAVQTYAALRGGGRAPVIYHPLPADVLQLVRTRSDGLLFDTFMDWAKASAQLHPDPIKQPDALEYLQSAINHLADLALRLVSRSPVPPEPIHLTPDDIVGPVNIRYAP